MDKKETILVINDEMPIREMIILFLEDNYLVLEASNGKEGLAKAKDNKPDLILLDVMMPEMDGYQVCKELKSVEESKDIPVIFLSSLSDPKDKIKGLEAGGVDFVTRAQDRGELIARVKTHLKIRALNRELETRNALLEAKQKDLDEDLKAAATIQRTLLPKDNISQKGLKIAWQCKPCEMIGGDVFNVIPLTDSLTAFYILDVSGHGVPSAMVTVSVTEQLQNLKDSYLLKESDKILSPKEIFSSLNRLFPLERFDKFFSIFFAIIDTANHTITYSNAGHPPPILFHLNGNMELLHSTSPVIGADESITFENNKVTLFAGDKLILYTDGIIELQNEKGEFYGSQPIFKILQKEKNETIDKTVESILTSLESFCGHAKPLDDISLLGISLI